jgi:hypothetical protein
MPAPTGTRRVGVSIPLNGEGGEKATVLHL